MKNALNPQEVFHWFARINQIPRPSKREEKMIAFLEAFGKERGLATKVDEAGNVCITKDATPGMENRKKVILQSHFDMVCEKRSDVDFDFDTDAIKTYVEGEWMKAEGTTLGADDGIGVAILDIEIASVVVHWHVVVAISCDTAELSILVEAIASTVLCILSLLLPYR